MHAVKASHSDPIHRTHIKGGYSITTDKGKPAADGTTSTQSITVHTNYGKDSVTMYRDGSNEVDDAGDRYELDEGTGGMLSGGEEVHEDYDKSVTVVATNAKHDYVSTTLSATPQGVQAATTAGRSPFGPFVFAMGAHGGEPPSSDDDVLSPTT